MDKKKIKKRGAKKLVSINIRITKELSKWLSEKKLSPTGIFMESCKDLGYEVA